MSRVCIYGCGAIGSLLAAKIAATGADVSVIARGEHLAAIRRRGLTLHLADGSDPLTVQLTASDRPGDLGEQDVVILTMKSHAVPAIADKVQPLLGEGTMVVTAFNGLPWWYFYGLPKNFGQPELISVDPGRKLWQAIGPERAIGCVVYPAAAIIEPGIVRHVFGDRFTLGEPASGSSERLQTLAALLQAAGFEASVSADIRADIWTKLVANAAFNPVSVMTGKTLGEMIDDAATCKLLEQIMAEVTAIASAQDVAVLMNPQQLLQATRQLGGHKTSMLQDLEAGRQLELAPIVGAVLELAGLWHVDAPGLRMVYQLAGVKMERA